MPKKAVITEPVAEPEVTEEVVETVEEPIVEKVEADVVTKGVVATGALNLRKGPGTEYLPIGTLYEGDTIEYVPENDEWLKVVSGGYVMKKFIR